MLSFGGSFVGSSVDLLVPRLLLRGTRCTTECVIVHLLHETIVLNLALAVSDAVFVQGARVLEKAGACLCAIVW